MEYIYEKKNSLDKELCQQLIDYFETSSAKYPGITGLGVNKDVKDSTDLHFKQDVNLFKDIDNKLYNELNHNLYKYIDNVNTKVQTIREKNFKDSGFQIQKYVKNEGKYTYHNDFMIDYKEKKHRILTYLWYLNDVDEGGETEFFGSYRIKPECGKLILFPASWTFPHCGKIPISKDKYIITGWIYVEDINYV